METSKTIGLIFIDKFADWEFGLLAASAVEWFDARAVALTPKGQPVRSIAGFQVSGERGLTPEENEDLNAVVLVGSEDWMSKSAPNPAPLLQTVLERRGVIGGICGGTLGLARAGLFSDRNHTSNGRNWISDYAPDYPGSERYQDVPHAVADRGVISAPGSAPGTFAIAVLEALYPERSRTIAEMRSLFAREYRQT